MRLYPDGRVEVELAVPRSLPLDQAQENVNALAAVYARDYYAHIIERVN